MYNYAGACTRAAEGSDLDQVFSPSSRYIYIYVYVYILRKVNE